MASSEASSSFVSVDVECAATGRGHNDRAPCRIGAVDETGMAIFDRAVKVPGLFNPLTAITGMTTAMIEKGMELEAAVEELRKKCLGPKVVLVGQAIYKDIQWLSLKRDRGAMTVRCRKSE